MEEYLTYDSDKLINEKKKSPRKPPRQSTSKLVPTKKLPAHQGGIKESNHHLLTTLHHSTNPITHSNSYERTEHVQTWANGHQNGSSSHGESWNKLRRIKLNKQAEERGIESDILKGVRGYISGGTGSVTNLDLIRFVQENGGEMRITPSATCTHIFSTSWLSGSKTQRFLSRKSNKIQVVTPDWIIDSILAGKRLNEAKYSVIHSENQQSIQSILGTTTSLKRSTSIASHESISDIPSYTESSKEGVKELNRRKIIAMRERGKIFDRVQIEEDEKLYINEGGEVGKEEEEEEEFELEMPSCGQAC